jgi:hypothetical protein
LDDGYAAFIGFKEHGRADAIEQKSTDKETDDEEEETGDEDE